MCMWQMDTLFCMTQLCQDNGVNISWMLKATWTFSEYSSVTRQGRLVLHFSLFLLESAWQYYIFPSEKAKFVRFFFTVTHSSSSKGRTRNPTSISKSAGRRDYYDLSSTNASQPSGKEVGTKWSVNSLPTCDFLISPQPAGVWEVEEVSSRFPVGNT